MKPEAALSAEQAHLADLLEAMQRCVYFLEASNRRCPWPLQSNLLSARRKDTRLFESLAAMNERFAKLQDTLGSAMRHAALLAGEKGDTFIRILAFFEKTGVISSVTAWQLRRTVRNMAAHAYETDYAEIAEYFNSLNSLIPDLYADTDRFLAFCRETLRILPSGGDFTQEFQQIVGGRTDQA